jgi:hypothetical protein
MAMIRDGKGRLMRRPMSDAEYERRTDPEGYYQHQVLDLLGRILSAVEQPRDITAPPPRPPQTPTPAPKPQLALLPGSKLLDVPL